MEPDSPPFQTKLLWIFQGFFFECGVVEIQFEKDEKSSPVAKRGRRARKNSLRLVNRAWLFSYLFRFLIFRVKRKKRQLPVGVVRGKHVTIFIDRFVFVFDTPARIFAKR